MNQLGHLKPSTKMRGLLPSVRLLARSYQTGGHRAKPKAAQAGCLHTKLGTPYGGGPLAVCHWGLCLPSRRRLSGTLLLTGRSRELPAVHSSLWRTGSGLFRDETSVGFWLPSLAESPGARRTAVVLLEGWNIRQLLDHLSHARRLLVWR